MTIKKCNRCGCVIDECESGISFKHKCGYNSNYDFSRVEVDLCDKCSDCLIEYLEECCIHSPFVD